MKIVYLFLAVYLIQSSVAAQPLLDIILEGIKNNYAIRSGEEKIKMSLNSEKSIDNYPPPVLNLELSQIPFDSYDLSSSPLSQSISLSQMFPIGNKTGKMSEVKKAETRINIETLQSERINLAMRISKAYYDLWMAGIKIEQNAKYHDILKNIREIYRLSSNLPDQSPVSILMLDNEIKVNENSRRILESEKYRASVQLNYLIGRDVSKEKITPLTSPADTIFEAENWSEENLFINHPEIKKSGRMKEMYEADIKANNSELIPDLMLEAMIMRMPQGMIVTEKALSMNEHGIASWKPEYMYSLMASITLPFAPWSVGKIVHKEESLKSGLASVEYETEEMKRMFSSELRALKEKISAYSGIVSDYKNVVIPSAEAVIEARKSAITTDRNAAYNILNELKMLNMAETDLYMYTAEMLMSKAEIEIMFGNFLNNGD